MTEIEIDVSGSASLSNAERIIENVCWREGLRTALKGSLAKYPGCVHWHFKKDRERGTLEITLWHKEHRAWFSIQSRRTGDWIAETIAQLKPRLEKELVLTDR